VKVITYWPALSPAIERAGHEPVLMPQNCGTCQRQKTCPIAASADHDAVLCNLWTPKDSHRE
jgi:hypothetical protein